MTEYQKGLQRAYGAHAAQARGTLLDGLAAVGLLLTLGLAAGHCPGLALLCAVSTGAAWVGLRQLFFGGRY